MEDHKSDQISKPWLIYIYSLVYRTDTPAINNMRQSLIFLILAFSFFSLISLSPVEHRPWLRLINVNGMEKVGFSRVTEGSSIPCSICHLEIGKTDAFRDSCGHGFHTKCLCRAFSNNQEIEQVRACQDCNENNHYALLLDHIVLNSSELPEGITYLPGALDIITIKTIWTNTIRLSNHVVLKLFFKIGLPVQGENFELIKTAARLASPEILEFLLDSGADLCSDPSQTVDLGFFVAVASSNLANAAIFLRRGANPNQTFMNEPRNSLSVAVLNEDVEAVKFLIDNNADVNLANPEDTSPIHLAVLKDNATIIELLMKSNRVNHKITNKNGRIHVLSAIFGCKFNALRALIDNGAPSVFYTAAGFNFLHCAIIVGNLDVVKFLISRGFDFATKDAGISFVLHLAIGREKSETVKFLLEFGADPHEKSIPIVLNSVKKLFPDYVNLLTPSDPPIVIAVFLNDFESFQAFLNAGMNSNTRIFNSTCSLLHLVCVLGRVKMAKLLISNGADINNLDADKRPPFHYSNQEFIDAVLRHDY